MSDKPVFSTTASMDSAAGIVSANKVLSNTYWVLGLTLAFSAMTAGLSLAVGAPYIGFFPTIIVFFGLLFLVEKTADSGWGLPAIFLLTGFLGFNLGPILSVALSFKAGGTMVMQALGGTALVFFSLSGYALSTRKDFSYLSGFVMTGVLLALAGLVINYFMAIPAVHLAIVSGLILVMSALILLETSRIVHGGETNYIRATVTLYVAVYNLFQSLLMLIMVFTGGDD